MQSYSVHEYGFLYRWPFFKGGPSPMSHLHCSFKNLLFAAPPRCCLYSYLLTTHGVWPANVAPRLYEVIESINLKPRFLYERATFSSGKVCEIGQVTGLICFFTRNFEGLIFDLRAKFSFLSEFRFEKELFRCHYWKWIKCQNVPYSFRIKKPNLAHDWKNAPKINLSLIEIKKRIQARYLPSFIDFSV